jgi:DNA primase
VKGKLQGDQFDDLLDESEYFKKDEQAEVLDITPPYSYTPLWLEPGLSSESLAPARAYLTSRGYSRETWESCGIGACYKSYFDERVVIPIIEEGKWKGFVARDWSGQSVRKYLYPIGMNRSELMWQRHLLSVETSSPILVVEGVFDALPYLGHAVACLGKPSRKQVEQLKCSRRPLVIVLDGDAWEEGKALSQVLSLSGVKSAYIKLDAGEDPGSVDSGWLLNEAFNRVS